ncbi:S8 family serine peptidase [Crocinitomix algicola]|uniref:S8 family serine peptidase n=1 Tax=Crocinitomix algicola TaxID=1740263 RepID=UPI000871EDBB|nr:S8 family serine peptidase [Crocinitomix algicola]
MRLLFFTLTLILSLYSFSQKPNFVPGELLVQFAPNTNTTEFKRSFEHDHQTVIKSIHQLSDVANIYRIKFNNSEVNLDLLIRKLRPYSSVGIIQKNHYVSNRETIPSDELFTEQWAHKNTGLDGGHVDADIDATDAWDITTGGLTTHNDTIVVCVLEGAGIEITHTDLSPNIWRNYGEIPDDGIDNDGNGYIDDFDGWNIQTDNDAVGSGTHGTRVSGAIGAVGNNDIGISGVNWNVKIMAVKGQVASDEASVIEAYSYPLNMRKIYNETFGEKGAFVVATNASWGIDNGDVEDSPLWCAMYDTLGKYGILNVGATTNNNVNVETAGDMPTNCTSEYFIGVTMTNNKDLRAGCGFGTTSVDLGAPGSNVRVTSAGNSYSSASGTSYAAPVVTGAIALAYSAPCPEFISLSKYDPEAAVLLMKDYILNGVDAVPGLVDDVATGGRLNVNNTINLMLADCEEDACIQPFYLRKSELSDTAITISWDGFSTDYILTIADEDGFSSTTLISEEFELRIDTLTPCTNYTVTIVADCGGGELSEASFPIEFTTDGCCQNPPLFVADKTINSMSIAWEEVLYATNYNLRYSISGEEDWTELLEVASPVLITDLDTCQDYDFQIHTVCGDSTRGYSESYIFRTLGCGACVEADYCPVIGANDNFEWIESVEINGAVRTTGANNGWYNEGDLLTALTPGESYEIKVTPGYSGGTFTERHSLFIDFNQDGEFTPPLEVIISDYSISGTMTETITIPPGAEIGITKMRIGMSYDIDPIACPETAFSGEYEDYCVYIGPQVGIEEYESSFKVYPNPTSDIFHIESNGQITTVRLYANDGKLVRTINDQFENGVNVSDLTPGIYIVQITAESIVETQKIIVH